MYVIHWKPLIKMSLKK